MIQAQPTRSPSHNWGLHQRISAHSRNNLPNPVMLPQDPYVPINGPAIGNLMDMFDFGRGSSMQVATADVKD